MKKFFLSLSFSHSRRVLLITLLPGACDTVRIERVKLKAHRARQSHPTPTQWRTFLENRVETSERDRLRLHLETCDSCLALVASLPPPPYRCLGRPLDASLCQFPTEAARTEAAVHSFCAENAPHGPVWLTAPAEGEAALTVLVALLGSQWRADGVSVEVAGLCHNGVLPSRPAARIAVWLDAPARLPATWLTPYPPQWTIFAGRHAPPSHAAVFALPSKTSVSLQRQNLRASLADPGAPAHPILLLNALGLDAPADLLPDPAPPEVAEVETPFGDPLGLWCSTEGQWLARDELCALWLVAPAAVSASLDRVLTRLRDAEVSPIFLDAFHQRRNELIPRPSSPIDQEGS